MNYTIVINQKAVIDANLDLDALDCIIIDAIRQFFSSGRAKEYNSGGLSYKWISATKIIADCPILGLKKEAIVKRLKILELKRIIERCPDNQAMSMSFFRAGQNWDYLFKSQVADMDTSLSIQIPSPMDVDTKPLSIQIPSPMDVDTNYHSTNNHSTINHITKPEKKEVFKKNERTNISTDDRSGNHLSGQQPGKKTEEAEQLTGHLPENTEKPFSKKEKNCAKKEKSCAKKESQSVPLPFGEKFAEAWAEWKAEKKAAHKFTYTERGEKAALAKLVNEAGTEKVAIAMIEQAIAHGWQGIYGLKQDKQPARIAASQESIDSLTDRSRWTIAKHVADEDLPF